MKIYIFTDSPTSGTGFGEEIRNLAFRWAQHGHDIFIHSIAYHGYPYKLYDTDFSDIPQKGAHITVLGDWGNPHDFGTIIFKENYKEYHPDIVLLFGDPHVLEKWVPLKKKLGFPLLIYVTLDGLPVNIRWLDKLNNTNLRITMTKWAQKHYRDVGVDSVTIHHGINPEWWSTTEENKQAMKQKYGLKQNYTYFISWDMNQHRKRFDALLRCWKQFKPETKRAKLILWTDWWCRLGWDLDWFIKQYDIPRDTIISPMDLTGRDKYWERAEPPEVHREIAMLGDIYTTTSSGEGFGKCNLEAMGLGLPVIYTDYSAMPEVIGNAGISVPITGTFRWHDNVRSVEGGLVDETLFTQALYRLYDNKEERKKLGDIGVKRVKMFDYDKVVNPQWLSLFSQINPDVIMAKEMGLI
jgi:glycosyltransferase involved in cell wall biosynthesis